MAESTRRGRLAVSLLLPLIVGAVLVLGGFLWRSMREVDKLRQRSVIEATLSLANEKVDRFDRVIIEQDNVVASLVDVADPRETARRWLPTASRETPTVRAVLVLDLGTDEAQVIGFASRSPGPEDEAFRRVLLTKFRPDLELGRPPIDELRHLHRAYGGQSYLISYFQRKVDDHPYLVVAWHDVPRLVHDVFPRLFADASGKSRVSVSDEEGRQVYGSFLRADELTVGRPFPTTLYAWRLSVTLTAADELAERVERRRTLELSVVILAGMVIILGLFFVLWAVERERRLSEQKSEFVANVSHELKTPLSLVRMFAELLHSGRVSGEGKQREYLEIIMAESERLTALIENVLDFARMGKGRSALDRGPVEVGDIVGKAVEVCRYRAEREGMEVTVEIPEGLGPVHADAGALELVVINLIDNAIKYAKDGKSVWVRARAVGQLVEFEVEDRGPGIAKETQRRVFDRFFRSKAARDSRVRGTGIGLSLVKHIAEEHGGYARVESDVGKGTRFVVGIPRGAPRPGAP